MSITVIDPGTFSSVQAAVAQANGTREAAVANAIGSAFGTDNVQLRLYTAGGVQLCVVTRGPVAVDVTSEQKSITLGAFVSYTYTSSGTPAYAIWANATTDILRSTAGVGSGDVMLLDAITANVPVSGGALTLLVDATLDTAVPTILVAGKYRTTQTYLFADVLPDTVLDYSHGTYSQTPARSSLADPKAAFNWGVLGPTYNYVCNRTEWAWLNGGGDWIDRTGAAQATGAPHFTFAANNVTSGSALYAVDVTHGVAAAFDTSRWNAYVVKCTGGSRALVSPHHPTLTSPSVLVTYTDATTATLACVACARLSNSTAYTMIGRTTASINQSVALEFERPTKAVATAIMTVAVDAHTATAATISGYLANPPVTNRPLSLGLAQAYPLDENIRNDGSVLFAHNYADGTALTDWVLTAVGAINVNNAANWSPDLFGLGAADDTKLPTAFGGTAVGGKWFVRSNISSFNNNVTLVSSTHVGDNFAPVAAGIGALRIVTPRSTAEDGAGLPSSGSLGCDMWALFSKDVSGLLDETYVRFYVRFASRPKRIADTNMYRQGGGGTAEYRIKEGKWGVGVHHWTHYGGNNGYPGSQNQGWTNRLYHYEAPADVPVAGMQVGVHSYDNFPSGDMLMFGNGGGMGAALYPDQWYCVEVRCRLNTWNSAGGSPADGVMQTWVDGVLVSEHTGWRYRDGPIDYAVTTPPGTYFAPYRNLGPIGLCINHYQGGVVACDEDTIAFITLVAAGTSYIGPADLTPNTGPVWAPAAGQIVTLAATNTRDSLDPRDDALANPDYPGAAPWESYTQWFHMTDYCGAVMASELGAGGTYMQYGAAGHSAVAACFWIGFDIADLTWKRIGPRPLPTDGVALGSQSTADLNTIYPASQFNPQWGEWQGGYSGWPSGFAQPGYNPPEGSHTRNNLVYRPPTTAGNTAGQVITTFTSTGIHTGLQQPYGSHVFDLDALSFARTNTLKPGQGGAVGGSEYFTQLDCVVALNRESSGFVTTVDVLNCATMAWARRNVSNGMVAYYDSTCFGWGDYFVLCVQNPNVPSAAPTFWAINAALLKAGAATGWQQLTVAASSYPRTSTNAMVTVSWALCPENGAYYAVNRQHGSSALWKLTPPVSGALADTWTITEQALTGTLACRTAGGSTGVVLDYRKLLWSTYARAFIWTDEYILSNPQAIRPVDIA